MAVADVSSVLLIAPVLAFLLVVLVVYAILSKTELLGDSKGLNVFVALIVGALFVAFAGSQEFVLRLVPWIAVLIVSFVFILLVVGVLGKDAEFLHKPLGIVFLVFAGIVFLVSGWFVFSDVLIRYLPGPFFGVGLEPTEFLFFDWLYSPRVFGAVLLIIASALVAWFLTKKG
jgi:hypothetical protein